MGQLPKFNTENEDLWLLQNHCPFQLDKLQLHTPQNCHNPQDWQQQNYKMNPKERCFNSLYKDLWLQMDGIAMKCYFANGPNVGYPWHFKGIITKFEWTGSQIIKINRNKFDRSGITPSYFPALMKMAIFGHFSQYRAKG